MGDKGNPDDDMDIIDEPDPNAGKVEYPDDIDETTQGHPDEPHIDDNLIIDFASDDTRSRAREALREGDQHDEIEYFSALITVIDYHRDPTFDAAELFNPMLTFLSTRDLLPVWTTIVRQPARKSDDATPRASIS